MQEAHDKSYEIKVANVYVNQKTTIDVLSLFTYLKKVIYIGGNRRKKRAHVLVSFMQTTQCGPCHELFEVL